MKIMKADENDGDRILNELNNSIRYWESNILTRIGMAQRQRAMGLIEAAEQSEEAVENGKEVLSDLKAQKEEYLS